MNRIYEKVIRLTKKHGSADPFSLCESMDITVLRCELPVCLNGFSQYHKRNKIIYINNSLGDMAQKAACAAELAHAVLHPPQEQPHLQYCGMPAQNPREREAEIFALCLLTQDVAFTACSYGGAGLDELNSLTGARKDGSKNAYCAENGA